MGSVGGISDRMDRDEARGIHKAIKAAGSELALAYKAGVSLAVVYKWRNAGGVLMTAHADKVSQVTGVPIAELVPSIKVATPDPEDAGQRNRRGRPRKGAKMTATYPASRRVLSIGNPATAIAVGQN